ncbi:MAG: Fic family protein [Candidatus Jordarchaeaceae archaeon]
MYIEPNLNRRIKEKVKKLKALRPLPPSAVNKLKEQFEIELTYHSDAIEGNRLTEKETFWVIKEGLTIKGKPLKDHLEAIGHKDALDYIYSLTKKKGEEIFTEHNIRMIHQLIMKRVDSQWAGKYRNGPVKITGSKYVPPESQKIPYLMRNLVLWIRKNPENLSVIELAALAHFKIVHIHPFFDGNGRLARLLMNIILLRAAYPIAVVLKFDRARYYRLLALADKGQFQPFINFIGRVVERSLDLYLKALEPIKKKKSEKYISLAEATKGTPYSQEYLSLLARRGKIEAFKIQRNWVTTREAMNRYIKEIRNKKK